MIEISNTTNLPAPFSKITAEKIAFSVLGKKYDLSVVFATPSLARKLNKKHRNKNYIPNVLSFTLSKNLGEIYICPEQCKKEFSKFDLPYKKFVVYLYIHGLLHLKGLDHGKKMEALEKTYLAKFSK